MTYKPIKSMRDIVEYMRNPHYCQATLHELLIGLITKPILHSPERRIAIYHEVLQHHPHEL